MRLGVHRIAALLMLISLCGPGVDRSAAAFDGSDELEYQVKAGFVFNFLKFVSWPQNAVTVGGSWRIGIVGGDDVTRTMSDTLAGKSISGRPVEVTAVDTVEGIGQCHVVFIAESHTESSEALVHNLRNTAVLFVGETPNFARSRGIIGFVKRRDNLRLEINPARARNAGLIISGKLASIADLVEDKS